jgi:hypothetical protein
MDRRTVAIILFGIICLTAGFMARQPDSPVGGNHAHPVAEATPTLSCKCEQETANDAEKSDSEPPQWYAAFKRPEWWLVFVGLGAFIAAILTLVHMRESSERQLRAYVVAELGNIVNVANPLPVGGNPAPQTDARVIYPNGPVARIQIKNTGQTPAFEVRHWGDICIREYPLVSELPPKPPGLIPVASNLGQGIISTKRFTRHSLLTPQQTTDLMKGIIAIYVYGEISYTDAFGIERHTQYRLMHHPFGGVIGVSTDLNFVEGGNKAD